MDRFIVPRLGLAVVIGVATLLIGVIVLRSPDTHSNLGTPLQSEYDRTAPSRVGEVVGDIELMPDYERLQARSPTKLEPGRAVFLGAACSTCHGLDARGGPVGPSLAGSEPDIVRRMVREGPAGMPAYSEKDLSNADVEKLVAYLQGLKAAPKPSADELLALEHMTYDPSVPLFSVLQGKAAMRRSCGACHQQPTKEQLLAAFPADFDATSLVAQMVRQANVSLDDGKLIARYILAIRNGKDPLKTP